MTSTKCQYNNIQSINNEFIPNIKNNLQLINIQSKPTIPMKTWLPWKPVERKKILLTEFKDKLK